MKIKIRILCGFLGIVGGVTWFLVYFSNMVVAVVLQDVSGLPLNLMVEITLAVWGLFFIGALIGKRKIFVAVSSFTVIACITTACSFISAAGQFSTNFGNVTSAFLGESVEGAQISYFKVMRQFLPSIICGVLGLIAALKFGKKPIIEKEV